MPELVGVAVCVTLGVGVALPVVVVEIVGRPVPLTDGVFEALAPGDRDDVGDALTVELGLTVVELVGGGVPLLEPVLVTVGDCESEGEGVAWPVPLSDPVPLALAPRDRVEDGVALIVELKLIVDELVDVGVPLTELVPLPVCDCEGDGEGVIGGVWESDPVLLALAPGDSEDVGEALVVELPLVVVEAVGLGVPLPEPVPLPVGDSEREGEGVGRPVPLLDPEFDALAPGEREDVGDALFVELPLSVVVAVGVGV